MSRPSQIRSVFFDSGNTLMYPIGNRWFPGPRFFEICLRAGQAIPDDEDLAQACEMATKYLGENHADCVDLSAEIDQFSMYYRILFNTLGRSVSEELIAELTRSIVHEVNFAPYSRTKDVLEAIQAQSIPMAVITDAWPSVRVKFEELGYLSYFQAFVVSAEQGCTKPDMGMFRPALEAIGVTPELVLFVDDCPETIDEVRNHGFQTLLADYEDSHPGRDDRITDVGQVLVHLGA